MIHATLQIKTSSHRALRKKTLAVIKDSSGKPILFCSLTPRSKKKKRRGEEPHFQKKWNEITRHREWNKVGHASATNAIISGREWSEKKKKPFFFSETVGGRPENEAKKRLFFFNAGRGASYPR